MGLRCVPQEAKRRWVLLEWTGATRGGERTGRWEIAARRCHPQPRWDRPLDVGGCDEGVRRFGRFLDAARREGTPLKGSAEVLRVSRQIHFFLPEDRPHRAARHASTRAPFRVRGDGHRVAQVGGTRTEWRAVASQPGREALAVNRPSGSRQEPCPESAKLGALVSVTRDRGFRGSPQRAAARRRARSC